MHCYDVMVQFWIQRKSDKVFRRILFSETDNPTLRIKFIKIYHSLVRKGTALPTIVHMWCFEMNRFDNNKYIEVVNYRVKGLLVTQNNLAIRFGLFFSSVQLNQRFRYRRSYHTYLIIIYGIYVLLCLLKMVCITFHPKINATKCMKTKGSL